MSSATYTSRLKQQYSKEIAPSLVKELSLKNKHEAPKVQTVIVSVGTGKSRDDKRVTEAVANTLTKITGQIPIETKARKSIAGFKLREGQKIGFKVTLRGNIMYDFIDKLINLVLPRVRDFHGINPNSFDKHGNISIGFRDQTVFPELGFDETVVLHGLQVTIVTNSGNPTYSKRLLELLGMPFEKNKE